jgi:glycerophosphoryl diester phosphodiesterase
MNKARIVALVAALTPILVVVGCSPVGWEFATAAGPVLPKISAHRGASSEAPENTLESVREAIDSGADSVEFDVRFSKASSTNPDGVPMLMHDATVDRTTECSGKVTDFIASKLAACNAGKWFSRGYDGVTAPSLYQVMKLIKESGWTGRIHLEVKTVQTPAQAALTLNRITRFGLQDRTTIISFSQPALAALKSAGWIGKTGWIFRTDDGWNATGYEELIPFGVVVTADQVKAAQARGVAVTVWSDRWNAEVASLGADYLSVNYLDEAIAYTKIVGSVCPAEVTDATVDSTFGSVTP